MAPALRIAISQFAVSGNLAANLNCIESHIKKAATQGAHVIQFPETALTGHVGVDFPSFARFEWTAVTTALEAIASLARNLKIWVIVGAYHRKKGEARPRNCLWVISDIGKLVARYDKRKLYGKESTCITPGNCGVTLCIHGNLCGFLICYDSCFPRLYESYRSQGVHLLFHSYYNARNNGFANRLDDLIRSQLAIRAADHGMWIAASNSSARHSRLASCITRPDGSCRSLKRHIPGILFHDFPDTDLQWTYDNRILER